jgi:3-isopropylmalate dehydrogenase
MEFNIALIPGDGIGPEVIKEATKVLDKVGELFSHTFKYTEVDAGGIAIDKHGEPLPQKSLEICKKSDAILLGAIGGAKWISLPLEQKPERALVILRKELELYANLRPAVLQDVLKDASPLKPEITEKGINIMVARDLIGGMFFCEKGIREGINGKEAYDVECYSEKEVRRIAIKAFEIARKRNKRLTSIDKANGLLSSELWRNVVNDVAKDYPDIELEHMYVDNASMQILRNPSHFDVIVASNAFGDIIADEASEIVGSIGILPSASLGDTKPAMFEPNQLHNSSPEIVGKNIANPIALILSAALMLRHSFNLEKEAKAIEDVVTSVLEKGYRTKDIMSDGMKLVGTKEMGDLIVEFLKK